MVHSVKAQVIPLASVRHERTLPVPGDVLVHMGDRVEPTQVIAQTDLPGDFQILPIARLLGVPVSRIDRYQRVSLGDQVQQGQVVAKRRGLLGRPVKSPLDGTVKACVGGRMLIEEHPTPFELRAYVYGTVTEVLKDYGAVIETVGAVVRGVWGTGGESFGVLKCMAKDPDELLQGSAISPACQGAILIGGAGIDESVFEQVQGLQLRGIVVGGLAPELIPQVEHLSFPVIVTEGIGTVPMSRPVYRLLTVNEGREASINGRVQSQWSVVRPEVVIPLPAESPPPAQKASDASLTVGTQVRVVRAPYIGTVGKIVGLPSHARGIETGAKVYGAEIDIGQRDPIFVPVANLEILRQTASTTRIDREQEAGPRR
jgi:hypothetical protein